MKIRVLITLLMLVLPVAVWSCVCVNMPLEKMYKRSDVVFLGYIDKIPDKKILKLYSEGKSNIVPMFKYKVIEGFKGIKESKTISLSISFSTTCQASMEKNIKAIVFAFKNSHGVLETSKCSTFLAQKYTYKNKTYGPSKQELNFKLEKLRKLMSNKALNSQPPAAGTPKSGAH